MSGLVNGLQNRLRRFESARHLFFFPTQQFFSDKSRKSLRVRSVKLLIEAIFAEVSYKDTDIREKLVPKVKEMNNLLASVKLSFSTAKKMLKE